MLLSLAIVLSTVTASAPRRVPRGRVLRARRPAPPCPGWAPTKAASATSVVALLAVLAVVLAIVVGFAPTIVDLVRLGEDGIDTVADELRSLGFSETSVSFVTGFIEAFERWVSTALGAIVGRLGDLTTVLLLGGFLTFFVLQDGDRAWGDVAHRLAGSHFDDLTARAEMALERVGRHLRARLRHGRDRRGLGLRVPRGARRSVRGAAGRPRVPGAGSSPISGRSSRPPWSCS